MIEYQFLVDVGFCSADERAKGWLEQPRREALCRVRRSSVVLHAANPADSTHVAVVRGINEFPVQLISFFESTCSSTGCSDAIERHSG